MVTAPSTKSPFFAQSNLTWLPESPQFTSSEFLRRKINRKHGLKLANYHDLHKYSVENYDFWLDLWDYLGIISSVPPTQAVLYPEDLSKIQWYPGARLNYAENLLYKGDCDTVVITAGNEHGDIVDYSSRQLRELVRKMASALRAAGLRKGDRVAGVVTNSINAIVVALATASIGGIFSSTATDMGVQGILDRYRQIKPKFIFSETQISYAGKAISLHNKILAVVENLSKGYGLRKAILFPSRVRGVREINVEAQGGIITTLDEFLDLDTGHPLTFEQLPFSHPLYILYSSGTSGKPKCIVHSAGGVLLQTKKDIKMMFNAGDEDTYFQYTTTGWMMWVFMLSGLACGSRIVLYDGSPFYPDLRAYLRFISDQNVSLLGTSPRFLAEVQASGIDPLTLTPTDAPTPAFATLRRIACTGSILTPPLYVWAQDAFGKRVYLFSTSGGTDICASFVTGSPSLPTHAGEIQCKSLGMKVEVWKSPEYATPGCDPSSLNIEHTSQPGELVCTRSHPSLPLYFWGDVGGGKLREAYYEAYAAVGGNVWRQGDFIVLNPKTKGMMILGRSDGVLNPSGIRFGSGEIYGVMEKEFKDLLEDSLCVGQRIAASTSSNLNSNFAANKSKHEGDERVLLFLKFKSEHRGKGTLDENLRKRIQETIKDRLSPRHVPEVVEEVEDIPYTVNGKKIEIAVKQIVSGVDVVPSGTVANPEVLQLYYRYRVGAGAKAKL